MKWLIAVIMLGNLIVFYWFNGGLHSLGDGSARPEHGSSVPSLTLLAEARQLMNTRAMTGEGIDDHELEVLPGQKDIAMQRCWALGPVVDASIVQQLVSEMKGFELVVARRQTDTRPYDGFWVRIPPLYAADVINGKSENLEARGIENFVFHDDTLNYGLSLGRFDSETEALARQKQAESSGYATEIEFLTQISTSFWVTLSSLAYESLSERFWLDIYESSPDLEAQAGFCEL